MGEVCPLNSIQHSYFTRAHGNLLAPRAHTRTYARTAPIPLALLGRHRDNRATPIHAPTSYFQPVLITNVSPIPCVTLRSTRHRERICRPCLARAAPPSCLFAYPSVPASCLEGEVARLHLRVSVGC